MANTPSTSDSTTSGDIPRRPYGNKGESLSILGFGGIIVTNTEQDHANRVVAESVERGINYFDVAPGYGDAEIQLGPALKPYRKDCFLACKTSQRNRPEAENEFRRSLERLKTDYFDLFQLHGLMSVENDVAPVFAPGGLMEFLVQMKNEGRIRHLGFSAHSEAAALTAMDRFDFDSILFPVSFCPILESGFGLKVIDAAGEKGMAILALKAMAHQMWSENHPDRSKFAKCWYEPLSDPRMAEMAFRFTLSHPVAAAVSPGSEAMLRMGFDFATRYRPPTDDEVQELRDLAAQSTPIFPQA